MGAHCGSRELMNALDTFRELTGALGIVSVHEVTADTRIAPSGSRTGHTLSSTRAL